MASYAAVIFLMHTIKSLQNTCYNYTTLPNSSLETLDFAYEQAQSLKQLLVLLDSDVIRMSKIWVHPKKVLRTGIVFESHLSNQFIKSEDGDDDDQMVQFVKEYNNSMDERVDASKGFVSEAIRKFEQLLESLVSKLRQPLPLQQLLEQIEQEKSSFKEWLENKNDDGDDGEKNSNMVRLLCEIPINWDLISGCCEPIKEWLGKKNDKNKQDDDDAISSRLIIKDDDDDKDHHDEDAVNKSQMIRLMTEFPLNWDLISEIRETIYTLTIKLEVFIQRLGRNRSTSSSETLNILDGQIREAAYKLQDVLESHHVSNQFLSQSECHPSSLFVDLKEAKPDIFSFAYFVRKMKEDYINELNNILPEEDGDGAISSRIEHFGGKKSTVVVGLSDEVHKLNELLIYSKGSYYSHIFLIVGMAGIGKTTLAKEIFENPSILRRFDRRAWVTVGPNYQLKEILQRILAQVNPDIEKILMEGGHTLANVKSMLYDSLKYKRYLIVLDDVWNSQVYEHLILLLPHDMKQNRVLLTTRLHEVAYFSSDYSTLNKRFMNKEESWWLLCEKVFGHEPCPPQLEKVGKKIAENCDGLPLTIITVADHLSKAEKTPEYWNKVAEKENSVFMDACDQMSEVLYPSYNYLSQHLKACFLYMALFPENYAILHSKLIDLLSVEEFLEPMPSKTIEGYAENCLKELLSKTLILIHKHGSTAKVKTYRVHSVFRHLCVKEAVKNKFFHVFNRYSDCLGDMKNQRRVLIYNNILFSIKDVYNSIASISSARSVLCTGPYHQYPVRICFELRMLRILDALTVRFYEFPMEVLKLVQLRYLALTFNGNLPCSISKLWKLQFLIARRHLSIKSSAYLPMEIWDMKNLKHIQIVGSNLREPYGEALLPYLLTLSDVNADSCTKGVFESIPNLIKLGIQFELVPDVDEPLSCFDHIRHLEKLESLKCVVVNPNLRFESVAPRLSIFPSSLKKLSLSGFGYPWKDMDVIGSLPYLKVLKLRCYTFRGPTWETLNDKFERLDFLLLEDTDLVHWTAGDRSFRWLKRLSIKNCYKLQEIPRKFDSIEKIEIVDSNPGVVACAIQIKKNHQLLYRGAVPEVDVNVHLLS